MRHLLLGETCLVPLIFLTVFAIFDLGLALQLNESHRFQRRASPPILTCAGQQFLGNRGPYSQTLCIETAKCVCREIDGKYSVECENKNTVQALICKSNCACCQDEQHTSSTFSNVAQPDTADHLRQCLVLEPVQNGTRQNQSAADQALTREEMRRKEEVGMAGVRLMVEAIQRQEEEERKEKEAKKKADEEKKKEKAKDWEDHYDGHGGNGGNNGGGGSGPSSGDDSDDSDDEDDYVHVNNPEHDVWVAIDSSGASGSGSSGGGSSHANSQQCNVTADSTQQHPPLGDPGQPPSPESSYATTPTSPQNPPPLSSVAPATLRLHHCPLRNMPCDGPRGCANLRGFRRKCRRCSAVQADPQNPTAFIGLCISAFASSMLPRRDLEGRQASELPGQNSTQYHSPLQLAPSSSPSLTSNPSLSSYSTLPCVCNASYVSHACCGAEAEANGGMVWESSRMKLGRLVPASA